MLMEILKIFLLKVTLKILNTSNVKNMSKYIFSNIILNNIDSNNMDEYLKKKKEDENFMKK